MSALSLLWFESSRPMLPGTNTANQLHGQSQDTFRHQTFSSNLIPTQNALRRSDGSAHAHLWPRAATSGAHRARRAGQLRALAQLPGPPPSTLNPPATTEPLFASLTTEPLRPRRLSAPVIARLIRSTTSVQDLADVVQQQLPYFDASHVNISLLHLALLVGRVQQQQPPPQQQPPSAPQQHPQLPQPPLSGQEAGVKGLQAAPSAGQLAATASAVAAAVTSSSTTTNSSGSSSSSSGPVASWPAVGGGGSAVGGAGEGRVGAMLPIHSVADEDGPLIMSDLLDEEEGEGAGGRAMGTAGQEGARGGRGAGAGAGWLEEEKRVVQEGQEGAAMTAAHAVNSGNNLSSSGSPDGASGSGVQGGPGAAATSAGAGGVTEYGREAAAMLDAVVAEEPGSQAAWRPWLPPLLEDGEEDGDEEEGEGEAGRSRVVPAAAVAVGTTTTNTAPANVKESSGSGSRSNRSHNGSDGQSAAAAEIRNCGDSGSEERPTTTSSGDLTSSSGPGATSATSTRILQTLLPAVFARMDELSGSDLAVVLSSLAVLRYSDKVVVGQLLQAAAVSFFRCRPQELCDVMVSCALLGLPPDADVRAGFYAALKAKSRKLRPRELALTLWAYGAGGTDVQEEAVTLLLEVSRPKLSGFTPLQLVKVLQGLAALRYRPPPEWSSAYCEVMRPALRRMSTQELCGLLLALARLQLPLDDPTRATLLVHTLSTLPACTPDQLAPSLWALGRLASSRPGGGPALLDLELTSRLLDAVAGQLGSYSGGQLAQLLEGVTRLGLQPPVEWMAGYVTALMPRLEELDARQLAGVLGSLAAQQYRPLPELQRAVLSTTQEHMQQLLSDTTCTASLLTALRRLSIEPPPDWTAALLAASTSALKNRCADLHLAALVAGLAGWGVAPGGAWVARLMWRSRMLIKQQRMCPRALVALLQAMSSLQLRPSPSWTALCLRAAAARASTPAFQPHHYGTLMAALHGLGVQPSQDWLTRMLLSTYRCWTRFSNTHWSSLLPALVLLQTRAPRVWLRRFESSTGPRLRDCSALQLLALLVSLSQLHAIGPATAAVVAEPVHEPSMTITGSADTEAAVAAEAATASSPTPRTGISPSPAPPPPPSLTSPSTAPVPGRPGPVWLSSWWSASTGLLGRMRYAPSELALTASWLVSLGLRPPPEWLQACAQVAERYARGMEPGERDQLAAALAPLLRRPESAAGDSNGGERPSLPPPAAASTQTSSLTVRNLELALEAAGIATGGAGEREQGARVRRRRQWARRWKQRRKAGRRAGAAAAAELEAAGVLAAEVEAALSAVSAGGVDR